MFDDAAQDLGGEAFLWVEAMGSVRPPMRAPPRNWAGGVLFDREA